MINRLSRLAHNPNAPKLLFAHALRVTRVCNRITFPIGGYKLRFNPTNVSAILWADPSFAAHDIRVLGKLLRPGDFVIDAGANIGHLALAAARIVGQSGRVVAIEAHPRTFGFLMKNLDVNPGSQIEALNFALGAENGEVSFSSQRADDQNHVEKDGGGVVVPLRLLDDLVPGDAPVALLKIDVEGFELFVFQGASKTLERTQIVMFEASEAFFSSFGYHTHDVIGLLHQSGFTVCSFAGDDAVRIVNESFVARGCHNMLAFRDEKEFSAKTGYRVERLS